MTHLLTFILVFAQNHPRLRQNRPCNGNARLRNLHVLCEVQKVHCDSYHTFRLHYGSVHSDRA